MTGIERLLPALVSGGVDFIVIGGVAGNLHGSARVTSDLDVVYDRGIQNLERLTKALAPFGPYLRGAPPGLPFRLDPDTLSHGLNFTLRTEHGDIDLLGEVVGGGGYRDLLPHSVEVEAVGLRFRCVSLPKLIQLKRAAGRPRDFDAIAELEVILEEQQRTE
jgi:predicted nucleotidyltransferase